jgi:hypothetical protein
MNNKHEVIITRIDLPFTNIIELVFHFTIAALTVAAAFAFFIMVVVMALGVVPL